MNKELIKALCGITIEDLYNYLVRYGGTEYENDEDCKMHFPEITKSLVLKVIDISDECPVCYHRFINSGSIHSDKCKLGQFLAI